MMMMMMMMMMIIIIIDRFTWRHDSILTSLSSHFNP